MQLSTDQLLTPSGETSKVDFISGVTILIDKPIGWTSFDVVNKIRFKIKHGLGIKKIKVGHAGTLDPLATGLLLICTGKLTKSIDLLQAKDKVYTGTIHVGATTPTYDSESVPDAMYPTDHITPTMIEEARLSFLGDLRQIPPVYSAIKINGSKSYELARRGSEVEMKARSVRIERFTLEVDSLDEQKEIAFSVLCSKGTYIRSLAYDFGNALDSGAYLSSLRREAIGEYHVKDAFTMDEILAFLDQAFGQ